MWQVKSVTGQKRDRMTHQSGLCGHGASTETRAKSQPVVAVVVDSFADYQQKVVAGVSTVLARAGLGTLCVAGRELAANRSSLSLAYAGANHIYSLVSKHQLRGVVVMSSSLGHHTSAAELGQCARAFGDVPLVSNARSCGRSGERYRQQ